MKLHETIEKQLEEYKKKIPTRVMNEDNPQYVLGWNACRYLSEKHLLVSMLAVLESCGEMMEKERCEVPKKPHAVSKEGLTVGFADEVIKYAGRVNYNKAIDDLSLSFQNEIELVKSKG